MLVVCDQDRFEVHTNFTGTAKQIYGFTLDDLLSPLPTPNCALPPLEILRAVFTAPEQLKPERAAIRVTEQVAAEFGALARSLQTRGEDPERAAHFLMRLLFCLFADSIGLLPEHLFRKMIEVDAGRPASFARKLRQLFTAMSTSGNNSTIPSCKTVATVFGSCAAAKPAPNSVAATAAMRAKRPYSNGNRRSRCARNHAITTSTR